MYCTKNLKNMLVKISNKWQTKSVQEVVVVDQGSNYILLTSMEIWIIIKRIWGLINNLMDNNNNLITGLVQIRHQQYNSQLKITILDQILILWWECNRITSHSTTHINMVINIKTLIKMVMVTKIIWIWTTSFIPSQIMFLVHSKEMTKIKSMKTITAVDQTLDMIQI